jgi:hypothetical protein
MKRSKQKAKYNRSPDIGSDWVPIQIPDSLEDMLEAMVQSTEERVGWCLLCNNAIKTEMDFIAGTHTHNCAEGKALELRIRKTAT